MLLQSLLGQWSACLSKAGSPSLLSFGQGSSSHLTSTFSGQFLTPPRPMQISILTINKLKLHFLRSWKVLQTQYHHRRPWPQPLRERNAAPADRISAYKVHNFVWPLDQCPIAISFFLGHSVTFGITRKSSGRGQSDLIKFGNFWTRVSVWVLDEWLMTRHCNLGSRAGRCPCKVL